MIIDLLLTVWVVLFNLLFNITVKNLKMKIEMQKMDIDHLENELSIVAIKTRLLEMKQNGE